MASLTYIKRRREAAKQKSRNANCSKAQKRMSRGLNEEEEFERARRADVLLNTLLIQNHRSGDAHRIAVWNGRGARLNQVSVAVDGKRWKNLGVVRLGKALAKILLK